MKTRPSVIDLEAKAASRRKLIAVWIAVPLIVGIALAYIEMAAENPTAAGVFMVCSGLMLGLAEWGGRG